MAASHDLVPHCIVQPRQPIRVALFQRIIPEYRVGVFSLLARQPGIQLTIYSGDFSARPAGTICLRTKSLRLGPLKIHFRPLLAMLRRQHDVIICEGRVSLLTSLLLSLLGNAVSARCIWWTSLHRADGIIALRRGVAGWLTRLALRRSSAVLTYGSLAAKVARASGVDARRIFVAHNALDTDRLLDIERAWRSQADRLERFQRERGLSGRRVILYVGRLVAQKRASWLIESLARLRDLKGGEDVRLVIIGDGPERPRLLAQVRARDLQDKVAFAGEIRDPAQSCPYFLSARVLALPGTGGLAINQAMTFGVPVVVAGGDGTENDSVVEGVNGYLIVPADLRRFIDRIGQIVRAEETKWMEMSAAARGSVARNVNARAMIGAMIVACQAVTRDSAVVDRRK